jgi:hypothetical protein
VFLVVLGAAWLWWGKHRRAPLIPQVEPVTGAQKEDQRIASRHQEFASKRASEHPLADEPVSHSAVAAELPSTYTTTPTEHENLSEEQGSAEVSSSSSSSMIARTDEAFNPPAEESEPQVVTSAPPTQNLSSNIAESARPK